MSAPDFTFEQSAISQGLIPCGVDEAGRGPWAGPVVAAAVILDPNNIPDGLNDSKKLNAARRAFLFNCIMQTAAVGVGLVASETIDEINILQATYRAMHEALYNLTIMPSLALIDGNRAPSISIRTQTIIGGDAKCLSIAAASIIAKVTRDRLMHELDKKYPTYGFAKHKGYGTAFHAAALERFGACPEHRKSYAPIAKLTITGQFDSRRTRKDS